MLKIIRKFTFNCMVNIQFSVCNLKDRIMELGMYLSGGVLAQLL